MGSALRSPHRCYPRYLDNIPTRKAHMRKAHTRKARKPKPPPFQDVERRIYHMTWKWCRMHGGDFDDLFSLATGVYLKLAGGKWDGIHDFVTSLRYYTWSAFSEHKRRLAKRQKRVPIDPFANPDLVPGPETFSVGEFADSLPADAGAVVRLVFDCPDGLIDLLRAQGGEQGGLRARRDKLGDPYHGYKGVIKRWLMTEQGWGERRVRESFRNVTEALLA